MKKRIADFTFETGTFPLVEVEIISCWVDSQHKAKTQHKVSSVRNKMVDGVDTEIVTVLKGYNFEFDYQGGNIFTEAMTALSTYLADPDN